MDVRSKEAIIAEEFLRTNGRKDLLADWEFMAALIAQCEQINDLPYEIPEIKMIGAAELEPFSRDVTAPLEKRIIHGVETILFNHKADNTNGMTVVYFHGGGYVFQAKYEHLGFAERFAAATDCKVIFPVYPLAPKYTYEDSYCAMIAFYRSLLKDRDADSIVFIGDSAGGGMALSLTKQLRDQGIPMPGKVILISPALDASMQNPEIDARNLPEIDPMLTHSFYLASEAWAAGTPLDHPYISPMYGDLTGLPPITVYVGTREMLWPDSQKFCVLAKEQGVEIDYREWPGMNHCFCIYPIPEGIATQDEMIDMIRALDAERKK